MKTLATKIALLSVFILWGGAVLAYTNPGKPTGAVNDYAGMLTSTERDALGAKAVDLFNSTGNAIVIVTIPTLAGDTIENYAVQLYKDWGVGDVEKDRGALIVVARNEREVRIEVGYGLEPVLTDAAASSIIRNIITPAFKNGDYAGGFSSALDAIGKLIAGDPSAVSPVSGNQSSSRINYSALFYFIIFGVPWLISSMARTRSWWFGGAYGFVLGFGISVVYQDVISYPWTLTIVLALIGFIIDFILSKIGGSGGSNRFGPFWPGGFGGFGGGGSGGGFGGFGGGSSGGGGASGRW